MLPCAAAAGGNGGASRIDVHQLDSATAPAALMELAGEEHRCVYYVDLSSSRPCNPPPAAGCSHQLCCPQGPRCLVLEHLPRADAIASAAGRRLFTLVEREDMFQVAREALVRSASRCKAGDPAGHYLRRCITCALQLHLHDHDRLVRITCREHEKGPSPFHHNSFGESAEDELSLLDMLPAGRPLPCGSPSSRGSP